MKYMGSKRWMLENGLGHILRDEVPAASRFVDLFSGSGVVASFVAQKTNRQVLAYDLQLFSTFLAGAIISRVRMLSVRPIWEAWLGRATTLLKAANKYHLANTPLIQVNSFSKKYVTVMRGESLESGMPVTTVYGGHYFSQAQSLWIDSLRATLPEVTDERCVALAALISASSQCVAAPGHTAQPFQPTTTAKRFLHEGWSRCICTKVLSALEEICRRYANVAGFSSVSDANLAAQNLSAGDLAFIDPPYSSVHYSRFYHVLETIAQGSCGEVSGIGRYPPSAERPRSKYSVASEARLAIEELLVTVAKRGATAIVTFPDKRCSNGISSYLLEKIAANCFRQITRKTVRGRFSTLGGDGKTREARQASAELVMILRP